MGARQSRPNATAAALAARKREKQERKEQEQQYRVTMAPIVLRDKEKEKFSFQNIQQEIENLMEQEKGMKTEIKNETREELNETREELNEEAVSPPVAVQVRRQIKPFIPEMKMLLRPSISPKPPMENYNFIVCLISAIVFTDDHNKRKIDIERVEKILQEKKKKQEYLFNQVNEGNQVFTELQERKNNLFSKLANFKKEEKNKIKQENEIKQGNELKNEEFAIEIHRDSPSPTDTTGLLRIPHLDMDDDDDLHNVLEKDNESIIDDDTESIRSNMIRVEISQRKARGSRKNKLAFGNITESDDRLFIETNQPQQIQQPQIVVKIEDIVEFLINKENEEKNPDMFKEYTEKMHSWNDSIWHSLSSSVLKKMASRFGVKPKGTKQELKKLILEKTTQHS